MSKYLTFFDYTDKILQYPKHFRKQRQELQECVKQPSRRFLREDFSIQVIMDCRTMPPINFKTRLEFNQQDPIMTQEQSILTKIRSIFPNEKIMFQYCALRFQTDAYIPKQKLAIEVDEKGHQDRDLEAEIERKKALEKELNYQN